MDKDFDIKFRQLLREKEEIEVPKRITDGIDTTLRTLQRNNSKANVIRKCMVAAALFLATTIGLGAAFPTIADNIPILNRILGENSIFSKATSSKDGYAHFDNLKNVKHYAIAVDETVGNITVKEIAYDGIAFYAIYDVQYDYKTEASKEAWSYDSSIEVKGKEFTAGVLIPEQVDDYTIRITQVYPVPGAVELPSSFSTIIRFAKNGIKSDSLQVSMKLDKEQLLASVKRLKLDKELKLGSNKAKLLLLTQSYAYASLTIEHNRYEPNKYDFVLIDDKGNELEQVDMGRIERSGLKTNVTRVYKLPKHAEINKILVIEANRKNSYKELNTHSPSKIKAKSFVNVDQQLPAQLSIGESKELSIVSISESEKSYDIIVKANRAMSISSFIRMGGISLYDKTKDKASDDSYRLPRFDPQGDCSYKITFYKSSDFNFKNAVLCFGNYDELLNELYTIEAQ